MAGSDGSVGGDGIPQFSAPGKGQGLSGTLICDDSSSDSSVNRRREAEDEAM